MKTSPIVREPAEEIATSCPDLMTDFVLTPEYKNDLKVALKEKKLITIKEKFMQVEYPRLEWINRVKKSFNVSLKNWNNKQYPSFYLSHDDEVITIAKSYSSALEKELNNQLDEESSKTLEMVRSWILSYENYNQELNNLLEERVTLQYNYSLLKKLNLKNENRDIQLSFKKDGVIKNQIFSLHPEDNTYKSLLGDLNNQMKDLDGGLIRDGKIKTRIIRQAMLQDMLTIVHRELESTVKNSDKIPTELMRELSRMQQTLSNSEFAPSTFGVYKITNKVFFGELMSLSKLNVVYDTFKNPLEKIKSIFSNFFDKKSTDADKVGFFSKIYAKITNLTPKQVGISTAVAATAGVGTYRYFWFEKSTVTELPSNDPHLVQLENTKKVLDVSHDAHSKVIEVQINEEIQK
jgi:hypothetical protein